MSQFYLDHYGFSVRPFSILPDPDMLFWSDRHRKAFAVLEYGLMTRAPLSVVTGEDGAGLGEADGAADLFDEDGPGALLEALDHLGDGGLGVAEGQGSSGEATLLGDGPHHAQPCGVDHGAHGRSAPGRVPILVG